MGIKFVFIENDKYKINIEKDEVFTINSTDNKPYDAVFNPENMTRSDWYKTFSISIENGDTQKQIALIGSPYGGDSDIAVQREDDLIVLMNNVITIIDCNEFKLKTHKSISGFGILLSLHEYENGFIIYGELEILKLTSDFDIEWTFSGADIFVSCDAGVTPFYIENNLIHLTDWNGKQYTVNKYGKEVSCK